MLTGTSSRLRGGRRGGNGGKRGVVNEEDERGMRVSEKDRGVEGEDGRVRRGLTVVWLEGETKAREEEEKRWFYQFRSREFLPFSSFPSSLSPCSLLLP